MLLSILALGAVMAPLADAKKTTSGHKSAREPKPLVIGHRGAGGFVPEHTLQSYRLAIKLGADYVEPDLVMTKDHVLIARHEPILGDSDPTTTGDSTNVGDHPEFASRETTRTLDGVPTKGFWAQDFTLAEIKTLGARQTRRRRGRLSSTASSRSRRSRSSSTWSSGESKKRHRRIGIYPETKHPTFHESQGLPLEGAIVQDAEEERAQQQELAGVPPVVRAGQPEEAEQHDQGAADPADGRERHGREREPDLRAAVRPALRLDRVGRTGPERHVRMVRHGRRASTR